MGNEPTWWELEPGTSFDPRWETEGPRPLGYLPQAVAGFLALATAVGMFLLRPADLPGGDLSFLGVGTRFYEAKVESVEEGPCEGTAEEDQVRCITVAFRLLEGPDLGDTVAEIFPQSGSAPAFAVDERVVLGYQPEAAEDFQYYFSDRDRRGVLMWVAIPFALAVVVLGRLRGLGALAGLAVTLVVLLQFVLPAILAGRSPVLVAVVGASAIAYAALYLAHGFTKMTTVALLGTLASLGLTALLSQLVMDLARISGFTSEESLLLTLVPGQLDIRGLVLSGVVLGALGAIDDMTVTQASAVWELRAAAPRMQHGELFRAGLRIGRDHVASTVNTLALAYAGASMPLLVLFVLTAQPLGIVANSEAVSTEILRTLVGSIGLVACVPITTWLAVRLAPSPEPTGSG